MAAANTPFSFSGSLVMPPDTGQPNATISFSGSGSFKSRADSVLNLEGSGSVSISFGTTPAEGAKAILIEVDTNSTGEPVLVTVNGANEGDIEISPGGFMVISNPVPVAGITSLAIAHTTDNVVRVWVLG